MSADERQGADKKLIAEKAVVEAMGQRAKEIGLIDDYDIVGVALREELRQLLDAALGATLDAGDCASCGGEGELWVGWDHADKEVCPDCSGGRVVRRRR